MTSSRSRKKSPNSLILPSLALIFLILTPQVSATPIFEDVDIPKSADAGDPIIISVNITSDVEMYEVLLRQSNAVTGIVSYDFMTLTSGNLTNGTWSFEIPAQPWESTLEYGITAKDIGGTSSYYPPDGSGNIQIIGDKPPKPFPWSLVFLVAFLAVAMIATELIFKPGFYRPTGRQRAKKLEEEDRKKEEESE